jgi:hypothetical protein
MSEFKFDTRSRILTDKAVTTLSAFGLQRLRGSLFRFDPSSGQAPLGRESLLNTPLFDSLIIEAGRYTEIDSQGREIEFEYPGIEIDEVIFEVGASKVIEKTDIPGRKGTIKEMIKISDYRIGIKVLVVGDPGSVPSQKIEDLRKILEAPVALEIRSAFLDLFDIRYIVVDSFSFGEIPGTLNVVTLSIEASSDIPLEVDLNETTEL